VNGDEEWMLPPLGNLETVKLAIAAVRRAMGYPGSRPKPPARASPVTPLTKRERELWGLVTAQANVAAVLLQMLEHASAADHGVPLSGEVVLDSIRAQQQARADLASLDEHGPFDV